MANRNIEAIEHKGKVYVSLEDMQAYLLSLVDKVSGVQAQYTLGYVLEQLHALRDGRPV